MKRLFLALLLVLAWAGKANAQGSFYRIGPFPQSGLAYVCPAPDGGTPCPSPSAIFSNATLTTAIPNPINMPQGATVSFYIAAGQYTIQFPVSGYNQIVTIGGSGGTANSWPVGPQVILASAPPYNVVPDGHWVSDASVTNNQPTVTCPNLDCNFTNTAKAGQAIYGISSGFTSTLGTASANCTILSIQTANSLTASCNSSATGTASVFLAWGTDWTSALNSAATAQVSGVPCNPTQLLLPGGVILISGPVGNIAPAAACNPGRFNGDGIGFGVEGVGGIMSGPEFLISPPAITNCTSGYLLFGYNEVTSLKHLRLFGGEYTGFANPGCNALLSVTNYSYLEDIRIDGIGSTSGLPAIAIANCEQCSLHEVNVQNAGVINCGATLQQVSFFNMYDSSGLVMKSGCVINDFNPLYAQSSSLNGGAGQAGVVDISGAGAVWHPHGGQVNITTGGATVNLRVGGGAQVILDNTAIGNGTGSQYGIFYDSGGGTVIAQNNSTIIGGTNGALNNVSNNTNAKFIDDGTTIFTGSLTNFLGQTNSTYLVKPQIGKLQQTVTTSTVGPTTVYTVPSNGTGVYRVCVNEHVTAAGTAGTIAPTISWNNGAAQSIAFPTLSLTSANNEYPGSTTSNPTCWTVSAANSTNIQITWTVAAATGTPSTTAEAWVEKQQ